MNILIIHNFYSTRGGEESVVAFQKELFESKGNNVYLYSRHYNEMNGWLLGKSWGTFTSIFNRKSRRDLDKIICDFKPDVAILHNLFPIISPSIIPFLKKKKVKSIQIVHNHRLFCPIGLFYTKNEICFKCLHFPREFNCFIHKCNNNYLASFSYSLRSFFTRLFKYYKSIDAFIVLSNFQKDILVQNGIKNNIHIIPNSIQDNNFKVINFEKKIQKKYIGYVGRLSLEKGIFDFINIAKLLPNYEFRIAGGNLNDINKELIPNNLFFEGYLNNFELNNFYKNAKIILVPSKCLETFGLSVIEAFANRTPVIGSNIAGIKDIIEHGKNGYLVDAGDIESMKKHIIDLFQNDHKYNEMTENAFNTFITKYSSEIYYERMMFAISKIPQPTNTDY